MQKLICLTKERVGLDDADVRVAVRVNDPEPAGGPTVDPSPSA